jgi:DNA-binding phage protein
VPTRRSSLTFGQLGDKVDALAKLKPEVAQALREERTALQIASAVAEILEFRGRSLGELAEKTGLGLEELDRIVSGTEERTSLVTMVQIGAALNYRFGFTFVPKELPLEHAATHMASMQKTTSTLAPGIHLPDYREVK